MRRSTILVEAFSGSGAGIAGRGEWRPGVRASLGGRTVSVIALETSGGLVKCIHGIGNPAKLAD